MNNKITDIIIIVSGLLGTVALGVIMLRAARWARNKNDELIKTKRTTQLELTQQALNEGTLPFASKAYWTANLSMAETILGKGLAIFAIIVISIFLVFACFVIIKVI